MTAAVGDDEGVVADIVTTAVEPCWDAGTLRTCARS